MTNSKKLQKIIQTNNNEILSLKEKRLTPLVICSSSNIFRQWRRRLKPGTYENIHCIYLYSSMELQGRSSDNTRIILLEGWQMSKVLDDSEVWNYLNIRFPEWQKQAVIKVSN